MVGEKAGSSWLGRHRCREEPGCEQAQSPSGHFPRPQKKSQKLLEEEQQIPSPEGTGEIHCIKRSEQTKAAAAAEAAGTRPWVQI